MREILRTLLMDTQKARLMDRDGNYVKVDGRGKPAVNSQETFYEQAVQAAREYGQEENFEVFIPLEAPDEDEEYKDQEE